MAEDGSADDTRHSPTTVRKSSYIKQSLRKRINVAIISAFTFLYRDSTLGHRGEDSKASNLIEGAIKVSSTPAHASLHT